MTASAAPEPAGVHWHARGLLFENCNCQLVCPGHMHFDQLCTHERCIGYWAIRIDEGRFGEVSLDGLKAVVAFDSPPHMISGDWTEVLIIDEAASPAQREALETILRGQAAGPWAVLARFVGRWLDTGTADRGRRRRHHQDVRASPASSTPSSPPSGAATDRSR